MFKVKFYIRHAVLLLCGSLIVGCSAIPSSGPSAKKIVSLGQQSEVQIPEVELIDVNHTVAQLLYKAQINQSFTQFGDGYASAGTLNIGDVLDIMIWEAPPAVLFGGGLSSMGSGSAHQTKLPEQLVTARGTVSVPFVGDISVVGKTPGQVQEIIKGRRIRI